MPQRAVGARVNFRLGVREGSWTHQCAEQGEAGGSRDRTNLHMESLIGSRKGWRCKWRGRLAAELDEPKAARAGQDPRWLSVVATRPRRQLTSTADGRRGASV